MHDVAALMQRSSLQPMLELHDSDDHGVSGWPDGLA